MPRKPRIVIPGLPHNIVLRGNNGRRLFSYETDRKSWLRCLERGLDKSGCLLNQLTLLGNHVHMVATPPEKTSLATMMHRSNHRYAQVRNQRRNGSGKLFEERFFSEPIEDGAHLMNVILYNDCNAFTAGMIDDPLAHDWSTGPIHAGNPEGSKIPASMLTPCRWYHELGGDPETRARVYAAAMSEYIARREPELTSVDRELHEPYSGRLLRPNGSSARESFLRFGREPK